MLIDVEHDDGVGEGESGVGVDEGTVVGSMPLLGKVLQDVGDERSFARKSE